MCVFSPVTNSTGEENGHRPTAKLPTPNLRPSSQDRATQTELTLQGLESGQERVPLALTRAVQSLSLEDALPEGMGVAQESLSKLEERGVLEEEEGEDDEDEQREERTGGRVKDSTWTPGVEDAIQPTRLVRRAGTEAQNHNGSPDDQAGSTPQTPVSGSPGPPKDQCPSPLSPILEDEKKPLCVCPNPPPAPSPSRLSRPQLLISCPNSLVTRPRGCRRSLHSLPCQSRLLLVYMQNPALLRSSRSSECLFPL